jgi:hypothetical protein
MPLTTDSTYYLKVALFAGGKAFCWSFIANLAELYQSQLTLQQNHLNLQYNLQWLIKQENSDWSWKGLWIIR